MDDPRQMYGHHHEVAGRTTRLRDQPLLPLPPASSASGLASLSTAIQTTLPAALSELDTPQRRFVRAALARYLWLPDTPARTSRYDYRLATAMFERGIELLVIDAALLLADTRRALREPWLTPLPQIRSFAYFQPTITEVLSNPRTPDVDYLTCLLRRLRPLAEVKLARIAHQRLDTHHRPGSPVPSMDMPQRRSRARRTR